MCGYWAQSFIFFTLKSSESLYTEVTEPCKVDIPIFTLQMKPRRLRNQSINK